MDWKNIVETITHQGINKSLGQNFLINETIIDHILDKIIIYNNVVEIGPGSGILSYGILKRLKKGDRLVLIEKDGKFINHLNKLLMPLARKKSINLTIIEGDGLEYVSQDSYQVISNIPYNISSNFFYNHLKNPHCDSLIIMVQKEFAEKIYSKTSYGLLGMIAQARGSVKSIMTLSPQSFHPAPSVYSQVIYYQSQWNNGPLLKSLWEIGNKSFSKPNKQLKNNINENYSHWLIENNKSHLRCQNLSPKDYLDWAQWINK